MMPSFFQGRVQWTHLALCACGIVLGAFGTFLWYEPEESDLNPGCLRAYPLLRPDLDCTSADADYARIERIQDEVTMLIEQEKASGAITRASVFVRDLTTRRYAKINPEEHYITGSLLKLPLAIAYYKFGELDGSILEQTFRYNAPSLGYRIEEWLPKKSLVPGVAYSTEDMIAQMLQESDNEAAQLLEERIDHAFFLKVISDLGISMPEDFDLTKNFVTVESYAAMFRSLYLSSYLNIDHSQHLLQLLSEASFSEGIKAGVPEEVIVAHKFGDREIVDTRTGSEVTAQLHDCGIVYKPNHPYLLCIMTEGAQHDRLPGVIARISALVYALE